MTARPLIRWLGRWEDNPVAALLITGVLFLILAAAIVSISHGSHTTGPHCWHDPCTVVA